jgi:hypothetical protein
VPNVAIHAVRRGRGGAEHVGRKRAEETFHESKVFYFVVRLEEQLARPELGEDAAHGPEVDRMAPAYA